MGRRSNFFLSTSKIESYFKSYEKKVLSIEDLNSILFEKHYEWQLPGRYNITRFINDLKKSSFVRYVQITLKNNDGDEVLITERFVKEPYSVFEIALSIKSNSYLSHYTAVFLNGFTEQIPKTIYVTHELSPKSNKNNILIQENVDKAFSKPQREPTQYYEFDGYRVFLLNGKNSNRAGIIKIDSVFGKNIPTTNLERTLIDIAVRPTYSGGIREVLNIFRDTIKNVSVNKMVAILSKLDFIYPYHQSLGFLLEKAGIQKESQLNLLRKKDIKINFYLDYDMKESAYSPEWKIFYPKGL